MTITLLLAWAEAHGGGFRWTADDFGTVLMTLMTALLSISARLLYTLRDDVRDMKRDVPEIKEAVKLHEKEIRWLTGKLIASEAIEEAERQNYSGADRRRTLRRDRDVVNDAFARPEDHPPHEGDDDR